MPPARVEDRLPMPHGIVALVLLAAIGYGILTGQILRISVSVVSLLAVLFFLHLLYRLVVAIEHIAYDS
ncbi:hypothetical protein [Natrinema salifodinae]|uniref:Uncharacterized protein n=1 Tax=Natrinema salifodinae TaxID=1202768 RepID=A0A1I0N6B8_9EURY|nr:hypothetical protein [Natrinema salifodinae]SEV96572.1 hypothetical protein SAMN05216285_1377 [Natrinema salifodinae]